MTYFDHLQYHHLLFLPNHPQTPVEVSSSSQVFLLEDKREMRYEINSVS